MAKKTLNRTTQCKTCPWRVDADPFEIPNGYSLELHKGLKNTIAEEGVLNIDCSLNVMACHYSKEGQEDYCVGWLINQLGAGNNIGLRLQMMNYSNAKDLKVIGDQHERFEDTIPKER